MKQLTRRDLAAALAMGAAAAQTQAPPALPTPAQDLEQARQAIQRNHEALASHKIDIAVEPAFQFKA